MAHCIGPLAPPEEEQGPWRIALATWPLQRRCKEQRGLKLVPVLGYKRAYYRQHRNTSGPSAWRIALAPCSLQRRCKEHKGTEIGPYSGIQRALL